MNFSVYLDDALAEALASTSEATGKSRNALVALAVREYLDRHSRRRWPPSVEAHMRSTDDASDVGTFEQHRDELGSPREPGF